MDKRVLVWSGLFVTGVLVGLELTWLENVWQRKAKPEAASPDAVTITLSAVIDGSDRFIFTRESAYNEHMGWAPPRQVVFNGEPWEDLSQPPPGWLQLAPTLDLAKATILTRKSRDLIALESTPEGFDIFFADTPMAAGDYEVTISIPKSR
jgi:hypothetical protein